jgi:hypothetical protein
MNISKSVIIITPDAHFILYKKLHLTLINLNVQQNLNNDNSAPADYLTTAYLYLLS